MLGGPGGAEELGWGGTRSRLKLGQAGRWRRRGLMPMQLPVPDGVKHSL